MSILRSATETSQQGDWQPVAEGFRRFELGKPTICAWVASEFPHRASACISRRMFPGTPSSRTMTTGIVNSRQRRAIASAPAASAGSANAAIT